MIGRLMFFGALFVIIVCRINCKVNEARVNNHPFETILSGGANLSKAAYTFLPPWTGFEIFVLSTGALGAILMYYGSKET